MQPGYEDIHSRIAEEPKWWDENGVPRYEPFEPRMCPRYAPTVALLRIACQDCGREFDVQLAETEYDENVPVNRWHYGDPPQHDKPPYSGCAGNTMNCYDLLVLQVWVWREGEWRRRRKLEGPGRNG